ncbi:hypothetical protein KKC88_03190 [Patescibacteria group bacterium]|nr:hypothetical protein [Patescibacteria group bacterium]
MKSSIENRNDTKESKEASEDIEIKVAKKIAKAFLSQKYPLTENGRALKNEVAAVLELKERSVRNERLLSLLYSLPTVEEPHLDLFADLLVDEKDDKLFGYDLANVQVTKGCRHHCSHCAAAAERNISFMPYPAILKISEKMRKQEDEISPLLKSWKEAHDLFRTENKEMIEKLEAEIRTFINDAKQVIEAEMVAHAPPGEIRMVIEDVTTWITYFQNGLLPDNNRSLIIDIQSWKKFALEIVRLENYGSSKIHQYVGGKLFELFEKSGVDEKFQNLAKKYWDFYKQHSISEKIPFIPRGFTLGAIKSPFANYYDNDVFDWRDTRFLHKDGSPADYGDVVAAMISSFRGLQIKTVGWPLKDKTAQKAAEKIKKIRDDGGKIVIEISVHPFEQGTDMDLIGYRNRVINAVKTLDPNKILMPDTDHAEFNEKIREYLISEFGWEKTGWPHSISRFSGRARKAGREKDHDVMSCMPGYHILPDGTVWLQDENADPYSEQGKGIRPVPMGKHLYELQGNAELVQLTTNQQVEHAVE